MANGVVANVATQLDGVGAVQSDAALVVVVNTVVACPRPGKLSNHVPVDGVSACET